MSYNGYAAFVQDVWRIKPKVTVNLGLRYEITTVMKEANNLIGNFDPVRGLQQVGVGGVTSPFNGDHNNFFLHGSALPGMSAAMARRLSAREAASSTSRLVWMPFNGQRVTSSVCA